MKNDKFTVFVLLPKLIKGTHPYKACIVKETAGKLTFVKWIKPVQYFHNVPEFLRDEFTKANGKLLKPNRIEGLPIATYDKPEKPVVDLKSFRK